MRRTPCGPARAPQEGRHDDDQPLRQLVRVQPRRGALPARDGRAHRADAGDLRRCRGHRAPGGRADLVSDRGQRPRGPPARRWSRPSRCRPTTSTMALQSEDPVRALVESGVVDRDAAQQVAAEHCTEAVGEMLDWTSGEFAVWVGSQDPSDIGVRLDVDDLVGAARERAQEWQDLRAALPDADSVLALVAERGPRTGRRHRGLGRAGARGRAADAGRGRWRPWAPPRWPGHSPGRS